MKQRFRRFELRKGNIEKFWEICRIDKNLHIRKGNLKRKPGEKEEPPKTIEKKDFRVAQIDHDKEIQRKLSQGYQEVRTPSTPSAELEANAIKLVSLDDKESMDLSESEILRILNILIQKEVVDRRAKTLDISKWERRILRFSEYESFDNIDAISADYVTLFAQWHDASKNDRQYNELEQIPAFKYTEPNYWIITADECTKIIDALQDSVEKERAKLQDKAAKNTSDDENAGDTTESAGSKLFELKDKWLQFHKNAKKVGGYEVRPAPIQFHSVKKGLQYLLDLPRWNPLYHFLSELEIWDDTAPEYMEQEFASVYEWSISKALEKFGLDAEPQPLDDGQKADISYQLQSIGDILNSTYKTHFKKGKSNDLADIAVRWNKTNIMLLSMVLDKIDEKVFTQEMQEFYAEFIDTQADYAVIAETGDEDLSGKIPASTQKIINEILNEACHLVNHSHQNIHNTDNVLISITEDETTNVFAPEVLALVIETLHDLYPNIQDVELEENESFVDKYTFRPSGLDGELMEYWSQLLPDAAVCIGLLQAYAEYSTLKAEFVESLQTALPTAKEVILHGMEQEAQYLDFQSEITKLHKGALQSHSETPGKVSWYKLVDHSEPWVLTTTELQIIVDAVKASKTKNTLVKEVAAFLDSCVEAGGCTLLDARHQ